MLESEKVLPLETNIPIPISWYQVAWSNELKIGSIKSAEIGGKKIVVFRGEDRKVYALDAFCPHLGAHLGIKGKVCNNFIQCGFHGWEFNGQGACVKIPQNAKITPKMNTKSWHTAEHYGIVFVYFDPQNSECTNEFIGVPQLECGNFGQPVGKLHKIHTRHSDVLENGVDMQHFTSVHGVPMNNPSIDEQQNGNLIFKHQTVTKRLGIHFDTLMEIKYIHPGLQIIHLHNVLGRECIMLSSVTPINKNLVHAHLTTHVKKGSLPFITKLLTHALSYFISATFAQDIPIWDAKIYKDRPILAKGDEGIQKFRRWYNQFPLAKI